MSKERALYASLPLDFSSSAAAFSDCTEEVDVAVCADLAFGCSLGGEAGGVGTRVSN